MLVKHKSIVKRENAPPAHNMIRANQPKAPCLTTNRCKRAKFAVSLSSLSPYLKLSLSPAVVSCSVLLAAANF